MNGRFQNDEWLSWPQCRAVMAALHDGAGGEVVARYVGGAVRDALIGRPVRDIDIATSLTPDAAALKLVARGLKVVPTGIDHGTITAIADGRTFEITTLRRDVETDGRHATVAFTGDWREDAARRDFTMNAIYADADGNLFDPFDGYQDLVAGRVRFIGDPAARIAEDALRILRFFRFHAWYGPDEGTGPMDAAGLAACRAWVARLAILSRERVRDEILRLLGAPNPGPTVAVMMQAGVLPAVLPEAVLVDRLDGLVALERALKMNDPLRRLGALLPDGAGDVGARLRLPKRDQLRLAEMILPRDEIAPGKSDNPFNRRMRALHYSLGREAFLDHLLLNWAERGASPRDKSWRAFLKAADVWPRPEFPLRGRDALALGVKPGPQVGDLLGELELWWASRDFRPSRSDLLERLEWRLKTGTGAHFHSPSHEPKG